MGLAVWKYLPMLRGMTRAWLRRTLTSILAVVFAASMSMSAVQAMEMATKMSMASAMGGGASDSKCPDCDHGKDMKGMNCGLPACTAPAIATLASAPVAVVRTDGFDLPVLAQTSLVGWAHPPDPYPPRPSTLG